MKTPSSDCFSAASGATRPTSCGCGSGTGAAPAWTDAGYPVTHMPLVDAAAVTGPVLDVRQDTEFEAGHLPGALHVELGELTATAADLPGDGLAAMCAHGERAATAASVLERAGR